MGLPDDYAERGHGFAGIVGGCGGNGREAHRGDRQTAGRRDRHLHYSRETGYEGRP